MFVFILVHEQYSLLLFSSLTLTLLSTQISHYLINFFLSWLTMF